ncbi:MAG: STAS domain-containing protein [Lentisphaeraceae bacterium]|nr:STAS domain-containing protein [Lentisphaeraceae bacterium]
MKHESFIKGAKLYIKCLDKNLNTKSITRDAAYPMINKEIRLIVLDLESTKNVDATGLSWLLEFAQKLSNVGRQLYLTEASTAYKYLQHLDVGSIIQAANTINQEKAI